jgi:hypothetical protein
VDLSKYQELTGTTVTSARSARVTATIKRVRHQLEQLLGYPLDPVNLKNLYTELGKVPNQDFWAFFDIDTITDNLLPPDDVINAYRIYDFNWADKYIAIDPQTTINAVKLVYNDITLKTFNPNEVRSEIGQDGLSKYIEIVDRLGFLRLDFNWQSIQLAVDADWTMEDTVPYDLLYLWAEMATYYSDPKQQVKSEQIGLRGGHRYEKYDKEVPEELARNQSILKQYAGPYGSMNQMPTIAAQPARTGRIFI